jgi:hypothetical protein
MGSSRYYYSPLLKGIGFARCPNSTTTFSFIGIDTAALIVDITRIVHGARDFPPYSKSRVVAFRIAHSFCA